MDDEEALLFAWSGAGALYFKVKSGGAWQAAKVYCPV